MHAYAMPKLLDQDVSVDLFDKYIVLPQTQAVITNLTVSRARWLCDGLQSKCK